MVHKYLRGPQSPYVYKVVNKGFCSSTDLKESWVLKERSGKSRPRRCRSKGVITSAQLFLSVYGRVKASGHTSRPVGSRREHEPGSGLINTLSRLPGHLRVCRLYNTCSVFPVILSLSPFELNKLSATMLQTLQLQL